MAVKNLASASRTTVATPAFSVRIGALERLPKWLNLVPMVLQWLWLSLRYRSLTLPSAANPAITCGGLAGEGKLEYFNAMGRIGRAATAPFVALCNKGPSQLDAALLAMSDAGLSFPLIAKPDIGWCGYGVRLVRNAGELANYLTGFPRAETIVLQQFVTYEGEAGIYYIRAPGAARGEILGVLLRSFPKVTGDGVSTVRELIKMDGRLQRLGRDGLSEPCCDVEQIPELGEIVRVSTIASTRVGGLYNDASEMITDEMVAAIDAIARDMGDFHVGRFDLRYESLGALAGGRDFTIIEVNGAGAEAVHAWEPSLSLRQSYAIIFDKQRRLFEIGAAMRRAGHRPVSLVSLARHYFRQQRLIAKYPPSN